MVTAKLEFDLTDRDTEHRFKRMLAADDNYSALWRIKELLSGWHMDSEPGEMPVMLNEIDDIIENIDFDIYT